jgi:hypothetical protein
LTASRPTCDTSLVRSTAFVSVLLLSCLAMAPAAAHAERPQELAHGRGFVYGASAIVPILAGELRYAEPPHAVANYVAPGFGVDAHAGIEFDGGFRLELVGGIDGHAVQSQTPLARYRVGASARYTLDLGADVYPFFAVGAALALFNRNASLASTLDVRGLVGVGWWLATWFGLELAVAVDVTPPGFAFTDTFAIVTPMIGVDLAY